jgi:prolyl oligopeptidase PreP (S9A serine peptidase family)
VNKWNQMMQQGLHCAVLGLAFAVGCGPASAASSAPPVEAFFSFPSFTGATLSPTGRYLAMRVPNEQVDRYMLAVYDSVQHKVTVVAKFATRDVADIEWVNDERILFDTSDKRRSWGDSVDGPGLWAVNADGSGMRQLVSMNSRSAAPPVLPPNHYMGPTGAQDSEWVYILAGVRSGGTVPKADYANLLRLNTLTGRTEGVKRPPNAQDYTLDDAGQPRLAMARTEGGRTVSYYIREDAEWRLLASYDAYKRDSWAFVPLSYTRDGTLYVRSNKGQDKAAVYTYDTHTNKLSDKPVVQLENHDFSGTLLVRDGKLLGVNYEADSEGTLWFDPEYKALQEEVDKLLPSTVNRLSVPRRAGTPNVLVVAYSDVQPAAYFLYNRSTRQLEPVGQTRPQIKPEQMGMQDVVRITARDGTQVPSMLTLPPGGAGKKHPMVVLVHGGPYVRGAHYGWNDETQFLASRGYLVLQPEFRGSTGYGKKHFEAGLKQWGLKMQDDIADATKWAIAQGYADPKRICIAGASYGGYATLMGLVNDPELYQCGINWVGVTDINLMYNGHWRFADDLGESWKKYGMPEMIGDQIKDAEQLKATSPLEQAARIKRPVLLAYGAADERVPLIHGLAFRDALVQTNKQVEWIQYDEEGHGWLLQKNNIDFWTRVEKFLDKHIGAGAKTE